MLDITVVILTYNEEKHIERCLENINGLVKRIVIVDSYSTDETVEICKKFGASVYQNKWINYAEQFQWGLDNCGINTAWTMRLDADEYFEPDLANELKQSLPSIESDINGLYLRRKVLFKGKWIRFGGFYPHILLRIWRTGHGRIEQRWMDEHIVLNPANTLMLINNLIDHNLNNIDWWTNKHNAYATREMVDLLNIKYGIATKDHALQQSNDIQAKTKRIIKEKIYARLPLGLRPLLYFLYRYILRLGFLDGAKGFVFHFLQGFWYRMLVDVKVKEIEEQANSASDVVALVKKIYGIELK